MREKSYLSLTLTEFDATGGYISAGLQYKFQLHVNFWNTEGEAGTKIPTIPEAPKGCMKVTLLDIPYKVPVITQIKLMPSGSKDTTVGKYTTFYHYFNMDTGNIGYDYIPYRKYQVPDFHTPSELLTPSNANPTMDFISYTGLPVVSFRYNTVNNPVTMNEIEFNKLPSIAFYTPVESGWVMPQIVDQVGQIKMQDKKLKVTYTDYKMVYPPTYRYLTFESLSFEGWESRWTLKGDEKDNDPIYITSGVTEYLNGSQVWDNEFVKRRNAGPQNRGLPLHEINSTTNPQSSPRMHFQGVDCKATHMAYKIGGVGTRATIEHVNYAGTDNQNEIVYANNPAVLLFNNSSSFYKRLPECWPWSCRRWTVESSVTGIKITGATGPTGATGATGATSSTVYKIITKYYSQNQGGQKIEVDYGAVPQVEIGFSSFTGKSQTKKLAILNGDPFPKLDVTALGKDNSAPTITYGDKMSYFNGYYYDKIEISKVDKKTKKESGLSDSDKLACGCKLDDIKVELATEIFPLLHKAECKLIMKMGYLCYSSGCPDPNIGTAVKKIIYPFNACKFNDSLTLPLDKLKFPDVDVDWNSITVMETEAVQVCYAVVNDYKNASAAYDANKNNVALMLHMDTLVDNSDNQLEIQSNGSISITDAVKKVGDSSLYIDGGNGYLNINSTNNALDLSNNSFTFEFWALPKSTSKDKNIVFTYGGFSFECSYTNTSWSVAMSNNGMSNQATMTCPTDINMWQNIAITRNGNTVSLYKNGKIQTSETFTKSISTFNKALKIGSPDTQTNPIIYIDELRVTKNTDRYNGENYTPQTTPFPSQDIASIDPCTFSNATTVSVADQDQFLKFPDATGYIMMIAKRSCFYTSDIQVYETKDNDINFLTTIPFNEVYDCETEFLGKVHIVGNGTDFPEPTGKIITGGDYYIKDSGHVYFNRCDRPYFAEIYKTQSLGNAGGFINFQSQCCDYCGVKTINNDGSEGSALVSPANGPLGNCSALDIEGSPLSIPQSIEAGACLYQDRKLCVNHYIFGKAKLKCYANMIGDMPIDPVELPCSGYIPLAEGFVAIRPIVTTHPQSAIVHIRQTATFTAAATGFPTPTIQWQISIDNGSIWVDIEGATSNSYSIVTSSLELDNGKQFRAIFKNVANTATTNAAILTVFN
jgi:hypothetical protein